MTTSNEGHRGPLSAHRLVVPSVRIVRIYRPYFAPAVVFGVSIVRTMSNTGEGG